MSIISIAMETNPVFSNNITRGSMYMKTAEDLGQILVVLHTLLVIIRLNTQFSVKGISLLNSEMSLSSSV